MTRTLAVSLFLVGALSLAIGTNEAEARHHRRNRCCNTGYANYGYQNANYGYQNAQGCCNSGCGTGTWNNGAYYNQGGTYQNYNQGGTYQNANPGNQTAPPPPTEPAPAPAPRT
jgi:hypothetical protein